MSGSREGARERHKDKGRTEASKVILFDLLNVKSSSLSDQYFQLFDKCAVKTKFNLREKVKSQAHTPYNCVMLIYLKCFIQCLLDTNAFLLPWC